MERYDFTIKSDVAGGVPEELDQLASKEMLAVHDAIQKIKAESKTEAISNHTKFFDSAIIPILKEYAEQSFSILDIERDRGTLVQATLRNSFGLDLSSDCHWLYMAIMAAAHICVDVEDDDPVLVLTYDLDHY